MRNHSQALYKLIISYTGVDDQVMATDVIYRQEHPACLESLRSYVRTGKWSDKDVKIDLPNGGWSSSHSHAVYLYEYLPSHIAERMSKLCAEDGVYAAAIMSAATLKAKESGESLSSIKAKITRMKNKAEDIRKIEHEYFLIIKKYKLFTIIDFDFEEPVCACCGKVYPTKYTIDVDHEAYCICCANEIDTNQSQSRLSAKTVRAIKDALHEQPSTSFTCTEDQINYQIQQIAAEQEAFSQFVNRMAMYYNADKDDKDIARIYMRAWKEITEERIAANISSIESIDDLRNVEKRLLAPRFDLEDVKILLKQLISI